MKARKPNIKQLQSLSKQVHNAHRIIGTGAWYAQRAYRILNDPYYSPSTYNTLVPAHQLAQWQFDRASECIDDALRDCYIIIAFFIKLKI